MEIASKPLNPLAYSKAFCALVSAAFAEISQPLSCTKYKMGICFKAAIWKASATSPSVTEASPNEQTVIGFSCESWTVLKVILGLLKFCFSRYCIPMATPVAGMACIPVAEDW